MRWLSSLLSPTSTSPHGMYPRSSRQLWTSGWCYYRQTMLFFVPKHRIIGNCSLNGDTLGAALEKNASVNLSVRFVSVGKDMVYRANVHLLLDSRQH